MKDHSTIEKVATLHPKIRDEVGDLIDKIEFAHPKFIVRVVQAFRTAEEQNALYAQGRTTPGKIVTNAKAWQSNHSYGLSLDFALMYDKDGNGNFETLSWSLSEDFDDDKQADWMEVVNAFKANGYEWGGSWVKFPDYPHIQKTFGLSLKQLYSKVTNHDFIPGTTYVNI